MKRKRKRTSCGKDETTRGNRKYVRKNTKHTRLTAQETHQWDEKGVMVAGEQARLEVENKKEHN